MDIVRASSSSLLPGYGEVTLLPAALLSLVQWTGASNCAACTASTSSKDSCTARCSFDVSKLDRWAEEFCSLLHGAYAGKEPLEILCQDEHTAKQD